MLLTHMTASTKGPEQLVRCCGSSTDRCFNNRHCDLHVDRIANHHLRDSVGPVEDLSIDCPSLFEQALNLGMELCYRFFRRHVFLHGGDNDGVWHYGKKVITVNIHCATWHDCGVPYVSCDDHPQPEPQKDEQPDAEHRHPRLPSS